MFYYLRAASQIQKAMSKTKHPKPNVIPIPIRKAKNDSIVQSLLPWTRSPILSMYPLTRLDKTKVWLSLLGY